MHILVGYEISPLIYSSWNSQIDEIGEERILVKKIFDFYILIEWYRVVKIVSGVYPSWTQIDIR